MEGMGQAESRDVVRVLVVDDDPDLVSLASEYLEYTDSSFTVVTETSAQDALARLSDTTRGFDCIVSDYEMPGMDGGQFHDALRECGANVPFILFTSKPAALFRERDPEEFTDFIRKDGTSGLFDELAERVSRAVAAGETC